ASTLMYNLSLHDALPICEGLKNVTSGANPMGLRRGIEQAVDVAVKELKEISKPVESKESIAQVASISGEDEEVGSLIAEAMERRSEEHTSELQSRFDLVC